MSRGPRKAERGELAFGNVDSFLIWRLTNGKVHVTDATNASRTLLFNIHLGAWDDDLLALFRIPRSMLPEVRIAPPNSARRRPNIWARRPPYAASPEISRRR